MDLADTNPALLVAAIAAAGTLLSLITIYLLRL